MHENVQINVETLVKSELDDFIENIYPYILRNRKIKLELTGEITIRESNFAIPYFYFYMKSDYKNTKFLDLIKSQIKKENRTKLKKIQRLSKVQQLEKLEENLLKTVFKANEKFSCRYGVELYLRDKQKFRKLVLYLSLLMKNPETVILVFTTLYYLDKLNKDNQLRLVHYLILQISTNDNDIYIPNTTTTTTNNNNNTTNDNKIIESHFTDKFATQCYMELLNCNDKIEKEIIRNIYLQKISEDKTDLIKKYKNLEELFI